MDILQQVLAAQPDAYTEADSVLRLARLLGVAQRTQEVRLTVMTYSLCTLAYWSHTRE